MFFLRLARNDLHSKELEIIEIQNYEEQVKTFSTWTSEATKSNSLSVTILEDLEFLLGLHSDGLLFLFSFLPA